VATNDDDILGAGRFPTEAHLPAAGGETCPGGVSEGAGEARREEGARHGEPADPVLSEPVLAEPVPAEGAAAAAPSPKRSRRGTFEVVVLVLLAFLLALSLKTYVAEAYEIKGKSMEPTFSDTERVVVLKAFYELGRGDIVVFESSEDPGKDLIKRVVGLPGETVEVRGGTVYVNGKPLDERAYSSRRSRRPFPSGRRAVARLGPDEYYVLGDNRPDSHDSRYFGPVRAESIKGKVVVRWWPFGQFASF
jgi:signal peptidase I